MKNQNIFDYMKLRASWGKLGNDKIAASAGFASIQNVQSVFGPNTAIDGFIKHHQLQLAGLGSSERNQRGRQLQYTEEPLERRHRLVLPSD